MKQLKATRAQIERFHDYKAVFDSEAGKRVLDDLNKSYGGECYVRGDINETLKRTVNRDLVDRIKYMIELADIAFEEEEDADIG